MTVHIHTVLDHYRGAIGQRRTAAAIRESLLQVPDNKIVTYSALDPTAITQRPPFIGKIKSHPS